LHNKYYEDHKEIKMELDDGCPLMTSYAWIMSSRTIISEHHGSGVNIFAPRF
jgi:hypothetical protein